MSSEGKIVEYKILVERFRGLQETFGQLQAHINELGLLKEAVSELNNVDADRGVLMPVGSGIFARGKFVGGELLMNVGAGVCIEKSVPEALESIDSQRVEIERVMINVESELEECLERIKSIQKEVK